MNNDKYLSIGALTRYLKAKFDSDVNLRTVFLRGEISNFKSHTTGHLYFSLKDETSKINAIMFASKAKNITFTPMDGTKVLVAGRVSVYEATGSYQIYVDEMLEDGVGNLYIAFEKLKKELAEKGMFDQKYKKPIPKIPERIGIITASTGAAIKDIISTIRRRYPLAETYLFPCLVQGEYAKDDIVKKIKQASNYDLDVLIVGRGGGSIEDLWAFNEEVVAKAIFECQIPIISAVGHEVDFTIADFVADLRAPTPSAAAELVTYDCVELKRLVENMKINIENKFVQKLSNLQTDVNYYINNIDRNINSMVNDELLHVNDILNHMDVCVSNNIDRTRYRVDILLNTLDKLNPARLLKSGYSYVVNENNEIVTYNNVKINDKLNITLSDVKLKAVVTNKENR